MMLASRTLQLAALLLWSVAACPAQVTLRDTVLRDRYTVAADVRLAGAVRFAGGLHLGAGAHEVVLADSADARVRGTCTYAPGYRSITVVPERDTLRAARLSFRAASAADELALRDWGVVDVVVAPPATLRDSVGIVHVDGYAAVRMTGCEFAGSGIAHAEDSAFANKASLLVIDGCFATNYGPLTIWNSRRVTLDSLLVTGNRTIDSVNVPGLLQYESLGAIWCGVTNDTLYVSNSLFTNHQTIGTGTYLASLETRIDNCVFAYNRSRAVFTHAAGRGVSRTVVTNCSFVNNASGRVGGLGDIEFANCVFYQNRDSSFIFSRGGNDVSFITGFSGPPPVATYITDSDAYCNNCPPGLFPSLRGGPAPFDADAAVTVLGRRLVGVVPAAGSPLVDAADAGIVADSLDLAGAPRVVGAGPDVGALERQTVVGLDPAPRDRDLASGLAVWPNPTAGPLSVRLTGPAARWPEVRLRLYGGDDRLAAASPPLAVAGAVAARPGLPRVPAGVYVLQAAPAADAPGADGGAAAAVATRVFVRP